MDGFFHGDRRCVSGDVVAGDGDAMGVLDGVVDSMILAIPLSSNIHIKSSLFIQ